MDLIYLKTLMRYMNLNMTLLKKISELKINPYNRTDGMSGELRYGIIKNNKKENTFIIINSNRTMIYDSRVGFLDLKTLCCGGHHVHITFFYGNF